MKILVKTFENQFSELHERSENLVSRIPDEKLFWKPAAVKNLYGAHSCGELILRSAGTVEQTFGGLTTRLWDDPFEWTLPEELSTKRKLIGYLNEVNAARINGFAFLKSDDDLYREIPAPQKLTTIARLLIKTIGKAERYFGEADNMYRNIAN